MTTTAERIRVGGDELTLRVTSAESGGAVMAMEVRIPAGGGPPALHRHDPDGIYRVERGELAIYRADEDGAIERVAAGPGAVVNIPGGREQPSATSRTRRRPPT